MAPVERQVCRFSAEPPQDSLPYGRWAQRLTEEFLAACLRVDSEGEQLGEPGAVTWFPDRTWSGVTYVPATVPTGGGYEYFGYVAFAPAAEGEEPGELVAWAEFTDETAARNPAWKLDLSDAEIGTWRGEEGRAAAMTLVWGVPLIGGGAIVTAELADLAVDQCALVEDRFTLIAPDGYRSDYLDVRLWSKGGEALASESLYDPDDDEEEEKSAAEE
ncbi:MAG: hypothetical protein ACR2HD_02735 [Solirubrobacteraceae bacterium]|nr:MAG: hypothetical protein DLM63_00585 [Solirubrobacterales bacterium]